MTASTTLNVDASSAAANFEFGAYLATFFSGLPQASYTFYGGTPDQAYGQVYYMNGTQLAFTFAGSDKIVLVEGVDLAYDWIHYGPGDGHGISGTIHSITFGTTGPGTQPKDGPEGHGELTGIDADVVFSGWEISASRGAGPTPSNPVYTLYNQMLKGGTDPAAVPALGATISTYTYDLVGSSHDDVLRGGAGDDVIDGGSGTDTVVYSGRRADYAVVDNGDGTLSVTDRWSDSDSGVDTVSGVELFQFSDGTVESAEVVGPAQTYVTIDASNATSGMDFEAFIRGGFLSDVAGGDFPVFDNGVAFNGEEMMLAFGETAESKYVLAHGSLGYAFNTHTVWGEINTIEYGKHGSGSYDSNGYFVGGDGELRITGLQLANPQPTNPQDEAEIEANGAVHSFATAHMGGAAANPAKLDKYANALDSAGQHFIGSAFADKYTGTAFDDRVESGGGDDQISASQGNDLVDGGNGEDRITFIGERNDYVIAKQADGRVVISHENGTSTTTLQNLETANFSDIQVDLDTLDEGILGRPPENIALSNLTVAENTAAGTVVGTLSATDPEGKAIHYRLTNSAAGRFSLVGNAILVSGNLDREAFAQHVIGIEAVDADGDTKAASFTIAVRHVDEAPSDIFLSRDHVREDADVGTRVGTLSALDPEGGGVTFSLASTANGRFKISGDHIVLARSLDYEKAQSHKVTIVAADGSGHFTVQTMTISVQDVPKTIVAKPTGGTTKGGVGVDIIKGGKSNDRLDAGDGNDKLSGGSGNDALYGQNGNDRLYGDGGRDRLSGGNGSDSLNGQSGNDQLTGGRGADHLTGGSGADSFVFTSIKDTTVDAVGQDSIRDFSRKAGDEIDLSAIDANLLRKGNQNFSFIGKSEFHNKAGELRYEKSAGQTYVYGDVDGDGVGDFAIHLKGSHDLTKGDFVL